MSQHDDYDDPSAALRFSFAVDDSGSESGFDALRTFAPGSSEAESGFDSLREYAQEQTEDSETDADAIRAQTSEGHEDEDAGELFTVTNPPRTVAVSALLDGRFERVHLAAQAATMTGSQLAEEILVLANLARQKALAGQHTLLMESPDVDEFMDESEAARDEDIAVGRDFLENDMGLISPERADAAQAEVFATRYGENQD